MKAHPARSEHDSGTTAPTRYERQKQRILDAATASLNAKGVWGMTLQEVAGALELGTSSVTYYFKRREQLAAAVFEDSLARLSDLAKAASKAPTPRARVANYIELYFDQFARGLRGETRPFAILSEIRTLEGEARSALIGQYQDVFRAVRGFFGAPETAERRTLLTGRAHILNEALFWSEIWLQRFAIGDFPAVRQRLLNLLDGGLLAPGRVWKAVPILPVSPQEVADQQAFLSAATRLINDFGYKGASVERITGELNRTKTALYRHIEGKDELVAACSRESYHRLASLQRLAGSSALPAWEKIATTVSSALTVQFSGEFPLLRSSALQALPGPVRSIALERSERSALALMGLLVDAMQEGSIRVVDPLIASHVLLSSIDASYDLKGWRTNQPLETAVNTYASILATGLFDPARD